MSENDETTKPDTVEAGAPEPVAEGDCAQEAKAIEEGVEAKPEPEHEPEPEPLTPEQIEDLKKRAAQSDEYLDLLKRARADFANFHKRTSEDRRRWAEQAKREILTGLLATADQCRVAAEKSGEDESIESLRGALGMVWSEFDRYLANAGVTAIAAKGAEFDPARHQALQVVTTEEHPDSTVVHEIVRGYEFQGYVLRPSQVVVSKVPPPPEPEPVPEAAPAEQQGAEGVDQPGGEEVTSDQPESECSQGATSSEAEPKDE